MRIVNYLLSLNYIELEYFTVSSRITHEKIGAFVILIGLQAVLLVDLMAI